MKGEQYEAVKYGRASFTIEPIRRYMWSVFRYLYVVPFTSGT